MSAHVQVVGAAPEGRALAGRPPGGTGFAVEAASDAGLRSSRSGSGPGRGIELAEHDAGVRTGLDGDAPR